MITRHKFPCSYYRNVKYFPNGMQSFNTGDICSVLMNGRVNGFWNGFWNGFILGAIDYFFDKKRKEDDTYQKIIRDKSEVAKKIAIDDNHTKNIIEIEDAKTENKIRIANNKTDNDIRRMEAETDNKIRLLQAKNDLKTAGKADDGSCRKGDEGEHATYAASLQDGTDLSAEAMPLFVAAKEMEMGEDVGDIEYVAGDVVRKGAVTVVYGDKAVGKSLFTQYVGWCISKGVPCLAFPDDQGHAQQHVLYFDAELTRDDYKKRGYVTTEWFKPLHGFRYNSARNIRDDLEKKLKEIKGDCTVILDCISARNKFGVDIYSPKNMSDLESALDDVKEKALKERTQTVTFIIVTHESADGSRARPRGCLDTWRNANAVIRVSKDRNKGCHTIDIKCNRNGRDGSWDVWIQKDSSSPLHFECCNGAEPLPNKPKPVPDGATCAASAKPKAAHGAYKSGMTIEQCLVDWGHTSDEVRSMKATCRDDETRKKLCMIATRLLKEGYSWGMIEETTAISKQNCATWKQLA